jgi:peptidoglycan/LPS O-acetylase OafA/YrhL
MPSPAVPSPSGALKFEAFDGLRAIAATLVIAYHVSLVEGLSRIGLLAPLASELKGGVTVFFVISGFLLYLPYARAIRDGSH